MPLINPALGVNLDNYNVLYTTTLQNYQPTVVDNFSDATPLVWWLTQNGRKQFYSGGVSIEEPLMYGSAPGQAFSGFDDLLTTPTEGMAPATYLAKKYQFPIVISCDHETDNMGEEALIDILDAKMKQVEISFFEMINFDLINNGYAGATAAVGTVTPDPKRVTGLLDFLQDANQARPVGGIAANTSWWNNSILDHAAAGAATLPQSMRTLKSKCSRGPDSPDLFLCSESVYLTYESQLVDQMRFVNTLAADQGFESLMIGKVTMLFDRDMPASVGMFLNSKYLKLRVHKNVDMVTLPFRMSERQWARFSRLFWKGELTCNNRKRQGLLYRASGTGFVVP